MLADINHQLLGPQNCAVAPLNRQAHFSIHYCKIGYFLLKKSKTF